MKLNNNAIYLIIAVIVVLMLIFGQNKNKIDVEEGAGAIEENVGSGILDIGTFPSSADVFMDGTYIGKSPLNIYNIPAGQHNVVIKKEGYEDFEKEVSVDAGKKALVEVSLSLIPAAEPQDVEEAKEIIETAKEEILKDNVINIGKKVLLYYDFSKKDFVSTRQTESDIFSKRYGTYIIFTRINPANIKAIGKNIDNVKKEDCAGIKGQFEWLYSGKSLCIITKENSIVALGGTWENTENAELKYKLFS
ncbi:MAG: PEGA domain-containing protein [Candidatus Woesearchaeota archaeon]